MLCEKCNGELVVKRGVWTCGSCGAQYLIDDYYEDIDVFICYVENDSSGRRTNDSIIAQELYQKIETKKIKAFYSRVSAGNLIGQEYEKTIVAAMNKAKVIILLATSKENFEVMSDLYSGVFEGKIVMPVFSKMDPINIPKNISSIQALNYDKIGSDVDLIKGLLNALGRENEVDKLVDTGKNINKKRMLFVISVFILVIGIVFVCAIMGKSWSHKDNNEEVDATNSDDNSAKYELAMTYITDEKYVDAIALLTDIPGYKDADKQLQKIYDIYSGYYQDLESGIDLYFQIIDGKNAEVEINYREGDQQVSINETFQIESNQISSDYNDSEGNLGDFKIVIMDDGLQLIIDTDSVKSNLHVPSFDIAFDISEKSDKPFERMISVDDLLEILDDKTSIAELKRQGYSVQRKKTVEHMEFGFCLYDIYQIENTDIELMVLYFDISTCEDPIKTCLDNEKNNTEEDSIVYGIMAPAEIVIPDLIGKEDTPFVQDGVLYVPNGCIDNEYNSDFNFGKHYEINIVDKNTPVGITSQNIVGQSRFQELVEGYCDSGGCYRNENYIEELYGEYVYEEVTEEYSYEEVVYEDITEEYYEEELPNVFCPQCGAGHIVTGVGNDGLFCDCGCNWMPICYNCWGEDAASIWIDGQFVCQSCGEGWIP